MPARIQKLLVITGFACALVFACLTIIGGERSTSKKAKTMDLQILRVPAITLETTPVTSTETIIFQKQDRMNPFRVIKNADSKLEVEANYRHQIVLNDTWNFVFDPNRGIASIIMPDLKPTTPVEFKIIQDKKLIGGFDVDSSWFCKFEDQKQIQERMALLDRLNRELVQRASSTSIMTVRVDDARHLVESYIRDWLIKEGHCKAEMHPVVKVFRKDELYHFPLPAGATLADFIPPIPAIQ